MICLNLGLKIKKIKTHTVSEIARYLVNGFFATAVHFLVLLIGIEMLNISSAGLANFTASLFGISSSFLGNRYFVFKNHSKPIHLQALPFVVIYASFAAYHGAFLYLWSDVYSLDYRIGFVIATAVQVTLSYIGNKMLVFNS